MDIFSDHMILIFSFSSLISLIIALLNVNYKLKKYGFMYIIYHFYEFIIFYINSFYQLMTDPCIYSCKNISAISAKF